MTGSEQAIRLEKLKNVMQNLQQAIEDKKGDEIYADIFTDRSYVDPTPNLVEGIFHVEKSSFKAICPCCVKNRDKDEEADKPEKKKKIVVYDARSLYIFDHKTKFRQWMV